jgi:hypothetical protein
MTETCLPCMALGAFCAGIAFGGLGLFLLWWKDRR